MHPVFNVMLTSKATDGTMRKFVQSVGTADACDSIQYNPLGSDVRATVARHRQHKTTKVSDLTCATSVRSRVRA